MIGAMGSEEERWAATEQEKNKMVTIGNSKNDGKGEQL